MFPFLTKSEMKVVSPKVETKVVCSVAVFHLWSLRRSKDTSSPLASVEETLEGRETACLEVLDVYPKLQYCFVRQLSSTIFCFSCRLSIIVALSFTLLLYRTFFSCLLKRHDATSQGSKSASSLTSTSFSRPSSCPPRLLVPHAHSVPNLCVPREYLLSLTWAFRYVHVALDTFVLYGVLGTRHMDDGGGSTSTTSATNSGRLPANSLPRPSKHRGMKKQSGLSNPSSTASGSAVCSTQGPRQVRPIHSELL